MILELSGQDASDSLMSGVPSYNSIHIEFDYEPPMPKFCSSKDAA